MNTERILYFLLVIVCVEAYDIKVKKDVEKYLEKYGYFSGKSYHSPTSTARANEKKKMNAIFAEGISAFQQFSGIQITGKMDERTMDFFNKPRCGMPERMDMMENKNMTRDRVSHPIARPPSRLRWRNRKQRRSFNNSMVFYRISTFPESFAKLGFDERTVANEIQRAFKLWENEANLRCREVTQYNKQRRTNKRPHINISFVVGEHGDGSAFGRMAVGNVAAHAFFPDHSHERFRGDIHFDDEREWSAFIKSGVNLYQVAAHEIGHALGLEHSRFEDSVMHMLLKPTLQPNFKLHEDDIQGIRNLYGVKPRPWFQTPSTTKAPSRTPMGQPRAKVNTMEQGPAMVIGPTSDRTLKEFWRCFSYLSDQTRMTYAKECYTHMVSNLLNSVLNKS